MQQRKVALIIMDGWAHAEPKDNNAIYRANTAFVDSLYEKYSNAELITCGESVGLPEGQMGNSEVGHLNLGAGRIVYQELLRINKAVRGGTFFENKTLLKAFQYAKAHNKKVHLMGLVSDGGVHSHIQHLFALCDMAKKEGLEDVFIHCFTDGRDTDPKSGAGYVQQLQEHLKSSAGKIASVVGRYYGMDRDRRWERVKLAYDLLVKGEGEHFTDPVEAIKNSYAEGVTDEFIKPKVMLDEAGKPVATIAEGDVVIAFNFRTDRCRQIVVALTQKDFPEYEMRKLDLYMVTMTEYDHKFQSVKVVFENLDLRNTLGEVLEREGKTQLRVAETEKYPHVTFFFSGGRETEFEGESRILIPSPKVATYDLQPEMSAPEVTRQVVEFINNKKPDFICLNYANADMVAHTGVFEAGVKAVETVDHCVQQVVETALNNGYDILLTADHGNADFMINDDGSPNTAHTTNPVPVFYISNNPMGEIRNGKLGDIAPTILKLMDISIPGDMTGAILID